MRIILAHNYYRQAGGEDQVFAAEDRLLRAHGHEVHRFTVHNDSVDGMSRLGLAGATIWNRRTASALRALARAERADLVHFHNTFPLISPAAYSAARIAGCAVVQTLHNFRLLCPNALLFREGRPCEACLGRAVAWPGVVHGCYRGSRAASAVVAAQIAVHRVLGTYRRKVDMFVTPSEFARTTLVRGGLSPRSVVAKPNFIDPDPGPGDGSGRFALFVGRLSEEKGVRTLLEAWRRGVRTVPLKIVGDGPMASEVQSAVRRIDGVEWLGRQPKEEVYRILGDAGLLILPSECYEGMPMTLLEAFARGTPVLASDHGSMRELVEPGETGARFRAGDPDDLALQADRLVADPAGLSAMRVRARQEFEARYTAAHNYHRLTAIYAQALTNAGRCETRHA